MRTFPCSARVFSSPSSARLSPRPPPCGSLSIKRKLMSTHWFRYASPTAFYPLAGTLVPWFAWTAAVLPAIGVYLGLVVPPADFQPGGADRNLFIHLPAAWINIVLYLVTA